MRKPDEYTIEVDFDPTLPEDVQLMIDEYLVSDRLQYRRLIEGPERYEDVEYWLKDQQFVLTLRALLSFYPETREPVNFNNVMDLLISGSCYFERTDVLKEILFFNTFNDNLHKFIAYSLEFFEILKKDDLPALDAFNNGERINFWSALMPCLRELEFKDDRERYGYAKRKLEAMEDDQIAFLNHCKMSWKGFSLDQLKDFFNSVIEMPAPILRFMTMLGFFEKSKFAYGEFGELMVLLLKKDLYLEMIEDVLYLFDDLSELKRLLSVEDEYFLDFFGKYEVCHGLLAEYREETHSSALRASATVLLN